MPLLDFVDLLKDLRTIYYRPFFQTLDFPMSFLFVMKGEIKKITRHCIEKGDHAKNINNKWKFRLIFIVSLNMKNLEVHANTSFMFSKHKKDVSKCWRNVL